MLANNTSLCRQDNQISYGVPDSTRGIGNISHGVLEERLILTLPLTLMGQRQCGHYGGLQNLRVRAERIKKWMKIRSYPHENL